ncbi:tegument protein UL23 [Panine betaherpesvirus 2]|uniref:Tegument protein UL23 n=1 Tax=Panine betaherpesvirus 2 TaxID=188763 RepID=Q8QS65_9BETA|nr:tegument protein UL23 [Panine betaherpesvirus 2]AAM00673.1 tegument protein UL23 [Panine betaherpesvirus 2]QXV67775.1 tegument protein UL23 [Panine betaherpesvirus 2]
MAHIVRDHIRDCFYSVLDRWKPPLESRPWKRGQRVALAWPRDRCLVVQQRWRSVRDEGLEAERLAGYLCCSERLRFVGSICTYRFLRKKGGSSRPAELYLADSGAVYLYTDHIYSDSLTWVAECFTEFLHMGLRRCGFITVPDEVPKNAKLKTLAACKHILDFATWRNMYSGQTIVLGDHSVVRVSVSQLYAWSELYGWQLMVGCSRVEPLGCLVVPGHIVNIFVDEYMRVFGTSHEGACIVADNLLEFATHGMLRYHYNGMFYGTKGMRRMNKPTCPRGRLHNSVRRRSP